MSKLKPIAKLNKEVLEDRFPIEVKYSFEQKKDGKNKNNLISKKGTLI